MASVASQLRKEVTAHAHSDSLEDAREICADGTYFPNNQRIIFRQYVNISVQWYYIYTPVTLWPIHNYTSVEWNYIYIQVTLW